MARRSSNAACVPGFRPAAGELIPWRVRRVSSGGAVPGWAMASAALSPLVMIGGWLAAEALQPPSYSPLRSTISVLAGLGGTDRWIMTSALFLVGAGYFVTAAGLPGVRVAARIVLVVAGLSSIGIAVSPEPAGGSTPRHLAWTSLGAVAITVWPAFTALRAPSRPLILRARGAGAVTAVFLALLAWLVFETQGGTALGLAERLVSAVEVTWPFVVALALRRGAGPGERSVEYWTSPHDRETATAARQPSPKNASADTRGVPELRLYPLACSFLDQLGPTEPGSTTTARSTRGTVMTRATPTSPPGPGSCTSPELPRRRGSGSGRCTNRWSRFSTSRATTRPATR